MGFSFRGTKRRDVDKERHLKRLHKTTPWIESPLTGADHEHLVFSQRHEANHVELFFDLFFVANLATFTTYHSVTDSDYLIAYIGFFGVLWSSWFQVTLHDVRFARDCIYERFCKAIQFIVFVGLALVGSSFNPGSLKGTNTNFRIMCYTLVISRALFSLQYGVVLFYTFRAKYSKLYLPLGLMIGIYALAAGAIAAMTPAFQHEFQENRGIYIVWYIVMIVEATAVITISCCWRMLSFKKTHLMERMSLLTLIVIGEGAIGVTKTVSRLMGKYGLEPEGCFLIMSIIMLLVFLWALYFDNFPHGHYGTIRQQIWSILHFPFQLAIVGVVEGSQQVVLARYVIKNYVKIEDYINEYCISDNLDGEKLRDNLVKLVNYWRFESKVETYTYHNASLELAYTVGNATNICSQANATSYLESDLWPAELNLLRVTMFDGVYTGLGMKIPVDKLESFFAFEVAIKSWKVVYLYYWSSFCLLIACSIAFLFLIRRHKADLFDYVSVIVRLIVLGIGASLIALSANADTLFSFISSPAVLPTCLALMFLVLFFDKISAAYCNWSLIRSGKPYGHEVDLEHHSTPGHSHRNSRLDATFEDRPKSAAWSSYSDTQPLATSTDYPGGQLYHMAPVPTRTPSPGYIPHL
ncbi:bacterial low temperature requirement A protein-domain-containing protein [Massariosphaeria phaeospora]|uniref:Bacterial low temperature requirement A protein-domain-containing protein n=1 Tax=Massariosphaeria phaeospora TaxID=100035 RepID=A0A7C8M7X0_9PLEO|nr:bacterial low temperature requirement A protein-domain-containing protein [Massariosphaeria phaeospora]